MQAFVQESAMAHAYDALVDKAYKLSVRETIARAGFFGSVGLAGNLGIVAVLGYGGVLTATEAITVGDLSAFLLYTAYAGASIAGLASFHAELMKGVGASTRVFELLEKRSGMSGTDTIPDSEFKGHIEFREVRCNACAHTLAPSHNVMPCVRAHVGDERCACCTLCPTLAPSDSDNVHHACTISRVRFTRARVVSPLFFVCVFFAPGWIHLPDTPRCDGPR